MKCHSSVWKWIFFQNPYLFVTRNIKKNIINVWIVHAYWESTSMNYTKTQFSKHCTVYPVELWFNPVRATCAALAQVMRTNSIDIISWNMRPKAHCFLAWNLSKIFLENFKNQMYKWMETLLKDNIFIDIRCKSKLNH